MREYTNKLLEMIEEDMIDPITVVEMCLSNDIIDLDEEDED